MTSNVHPPKFLSVQQVADLLEISTKTVRRLIATGKIHVHTFGRVHRVSEEDLTAFVRVSRN